MPPLSSLRPGLASGLFSLLLAAGSGAAVLAPAPPAVAAARQSAAETYTFAFQDADISAIAQEIFGEIGVAYTLDPAVTGKMSFRIDQRLTRAQLLEAFETALAANGVVLIRDGDSLLLTPRAKAKTAAGIRPAGEAARRSGGYEVVAVPLSYASPSEVGKALESMTAANTVIYSNDKLGLLILGGSGQELQSALDALKIFDQSLFEDSKIRWYELNQAPATTVAAELDRLLQAAGMSGVSIVPLKRLNGVIIFGRTTVALDEVGKWVTKLDTVGKEASSSMWVYHPRNTSAEALSRTLNAVLNGQTSVDQTSTTTTNSTRQSGLSTGLASPAAATAATSSTPVASTTTNTQSNFSFGSGDEAVRIGVDKETNTLLVFAPASRWVQMQKILAEIDRTPSQILIEASILEVTLGDDFRFGVDWSVLSSNGKLAANAINNQTGTIAATFPGFNVTYLSKDISAAISALGSKTTVEVVSAPKVLALDNHTARLQVGDQVPIVTQNSQSTTGGNTPIINSVDYRNTGVILNVTPRISGDDRVVLDVSQEVSSVAQTKTSGIDSPTIQQRKIESTLVLNNGGAVALGGLISTNNTTGDSGIPYLKDIPWAGNLFKSQSHNTKRTELIVLLTAKIIRDQASADRVMGDLYSDLREMQARGFLPKVR